MMRRSGIFRRRRSGGLPYSERERAWLEHFRELVRRLREADEALSAIAWRMGDWVNERDLGDAEMARVAADIGVPFDTLKKRSLVARRFDPSQRRAGLYFEHHAAVAALPVEIGNLLLERAGAEGWDVEKMRKKARIKARRYT